MKSAYTETVLLLERLHRRFLDVVKTELDRLKISDVNNVQTLILHNIGEEELTISELTHRGYYLGSNVSYNVKKLVENGYLVQEQSKHDKRSSKVRLSDKGLDLCRKVDALYQKNVRDLGNHQITEANLTTINQTLNRLEQYWSYYMNNVYKMGG